MGPQEDELGSDSPVGQCNLRASRRGGRRRHARDDFKIHSGVAQGGNLLARAAENQWIASLQPNHLFRRGYIRDEKRVNFFLGDRFCAATFSHVTQGRSGGHDAQNFRRNQRVVQNDLRRAQNVEGFARQQIRIARPRTPEIDFPTLALCGGILPRPELRKGTLAREFPQNCASALGRNGGLEKLAPLPADLFQPRPIFWTKPLFKLAAETLSQEGNMPVSGNSQVEQATADERRVV